MEKQDAKRRLAAIMATDVVGYSRMMSVDEAGTLAALKRHRETLFDPAVAAHSGRIVKLIGDGALVEFPSVVDAVRCAIAIQRRLAEQPPEIENRITLRIGLNLGDVIIDENDIYGDGVNIAARLEAQAPKGGILVSDLVHTQVRGKVGVDFADAGEVRLKNMDRPLRVWRWAADDVAPLTGVVATNTLVRSEKPSVAVMPFVNLSSDAEQQFFADGLALDLESALGLIDGISLRQAGAAVDYQLTGSVRVASGQIRVTARLAESASNRQLWSGRFDGRTADIFALQEEITRQVAVTLQVTLTSGDYARLWDGQTKSLAAWERCVVANGYHERWSEADNRRARELLLEALEIDPEYVAAKMLLGKTWWYDARYYAHGEEREHALAEAERIAREVLERRPDSGVAMMMLGGIAWLQDRHDEALSLCRRAARLCPSDAWVLGFFGLLSVFSGDLNEALVVLERAARLSPQTFTWIDFHIGHARAWLGDDAGAQASLHRYISKNLHDVWGYLMLAVIHGFAGRKVEARSAVEEAVRQKPDIDVEQVRRSNRYRQPERLERVLAVLRDAGLPE